MIGERPQLKGLFIALLGVVAISPDSLLIRLIAVDVWTLSFWRGLLLAITITAVQGLRHGRHLTRGYRAVGRRGLLAGAVSGVGTVLFVSAVTYTTVANVLIIIGLAPLFAALLGWLLLGEAVPLRTWIAIVAALAGTGIAVGGGIEGPRIGDLFAFGTALCVAGYLTTIRSAGHDVDMTPCVVISGVITAGFCWPVADPLNVPG
ncbi:MAG: EamA family transporter, partial [Candidatus Latescibacterota bacterium]|nr:EamA family transporter [Candidatus Latescibacterota bacterium]